MKILYKILLYTGACSLLFGVIFRSHLLSDIFEIFGAALCVLSLAAGCLFNSVQIDNQLSECKPSAIFTIVKNILCVLIGLATTSLSIFVAYTCIASYRTPSEILLLSMFFVIAIISIYFSCRAVTNIIKK